MSRGDSTDGKNLELGFVTHNIVGTTAHQESIGSESTDDRVGSIVEGDLIVGSNAQVDRLDQADRSIVEEEGFSIITQDGVSSNASGDLVFAVTTKNGVLTRARFNHIVIAFGHRCIAGLNLGQDTIGKGRIAVVANDNITAFSTGDEVSTSTSQDGVVSISGVNEIRGT